MAGLVVGAGGTNGVGETATANIATDGVFDSQGYVIVGLRGTQGDLNVTNGGTVMVGTTLTVGSGGTIAPGTIETGSGTLSIGAGSTVELTGTAQTANYGIYIGNSNDGTLSTENGVATVSGTGALLNTNGNGLAIAQFGNGTLTVSQGGNVVSGTPDSSLVAALGVGRQGAGGLTVTGAGSQLTADGSAYFGRDGSGSLVVSNQGSVVVGLDLLGNGGLNIGGTGTTSGGTLFIGGTGTALVTSGGSVFSQANIDVGQNGATGTLTVQGGSVTAANRLLIGNTITMAAGSTLIAPAGTTAATANTVESGIGVVSVGAGGVLTADGTNIASAGTAAIVLGSGAGSTASLAVSGTGATVNSVGLAIAIGSVGQGSVLVSQGGSVLAGTPFASDAAIAIGVSAGATGALTVTDPGSGVDAVGQINVGAGGAGSLLIENQATVQSGNAVVSATQGFDIAASSGSNGNATVTGTKSLLSNTGRFVVGDMGLGSLAIQAGGSVITNPGTGSLPAAAIIANSAGGAGSSVNVTGAGSTWQITGTLDVGNAGFGQLSISQGATVAAAGLDAGVTAQGAIDLSGAGSTLKLTGDATVADAGSAEMSILNGATVSGTDLTVGSQGTSSGILTVSDAGSLLTLSGTLYIGTADGVGDLTVGPGATIIATSVQQQGQVVLEGGLLDPNVVNVTAGQIIGGFGATGGTGDLIDNDGTLLAKAGTKASQKVMTFLGTIVGQGIMQIDAGSTLELTGPVLSGSPVVDVNNDGTPVAVPSSQTVIFETGTAGALQLDAIGGFAGTIGAYYAGDLFVISGGVLSGLAVSNGDTLTVNDGGGIDSIAFAAPLSAGQFAIVGGNTIEVVQCFAAGTRLLTARGPVAVEDLSRGRSVGHRRGGALRTRPMDRAAGGELRRASEAGAGVAGAGAAGGVGAAAAGAGFVVVAGSRGVRQRRAGAGEASDQRQLDRAGATQDGDLLPRRTAVPRADPGRGAGGRVLPRRGRPVELRERRRCGGVIPELHVVEVGDGRLRAAGGHRAGTRGGSGGGGGGGGEKAQGGRVRMVRQTALHPDHGVAGRSVAPPGLQTGQPSGKRRLQRLTMVLHSRVQPEQESATAFRGGPVRITRAPQHVG